MPYSYTLFTGNGSTTQYAVAFGYIRREHVLATVAGSLATFTWVNSSLIQMDTAPANGAVVRVYRVTPLTAPLVDFTDGSTLVAADLDTNAKQGIYAQQELDDALVDGLAGVIPNGDKGDITTSVNGTVWTIDTGAVVEGKIATGAITETKLGTGAVTSAKILDGTILDADVNASAGIVATKLAFTQSGTGATARTVDSRLKDVVSVKDFGAVGDGVADDRAAIQAAIDYALTQYQRVIGIIGGSFPVKKARVIFPPGVYNVSSTLTANGAGYQCVTLEGEGTATIRFTGATGPCIYLRPIDAGLPLMTTPVEIKNLSIRKDDKSSGSVGLVVERMTNCSFEALNFYGFQYAIKVEGAIDCDFDFKGQAIENCTFGILIQQKTALGNVIKPNLTRIRNAYFISCATNAIVIRKNPDESAVNNGAGSVISIEDANFQCYSSGAAVSVESLGEVPDAGTVSLSRCWWEGHSLTALSLSNSQAVLNQCFITDAATAGGGRQIQLMDTTSRVTINELDAVFGVSPTQNAIVSRSAGTTSGLDAQVIARNVRISNPGISSVLLVPAGTCPVAVGNQSNIQTFDCVKSKYFHTQTVTTGSLAASGGSESVYDMNGNAGCYRVSAIQADGGIVWRGFADIFFNGASSSSITSTVNNISFTTTGSAIYVNNTNTSSSIQLIVSVLRVL